jgi:hypothetical protein
MKKIKFILPIAVSILSLILGYYYWRQANEPAKLSVENVDLFDSPAWELEKVDIKTMRSYFNLIESFKRELNNLGFNLHDNSLIESSSVSKRSEQELEWYETLEKEGLFNFTNKSEYFKYKWLLDECRKHDLVFYSWVEEHNFKPYILCRLEERSIWKQDKDLKDYIFSDNKYPFMIFKLKNPKMADLSSELQALKDNFEYYNKEEQKELQEKIDKMELELAEFREPIIDVRLKNVGDKVAHIYSARVEIVAVYPEGLGPGYHLNPTTEKAINLVVSIDNITKTSLAEVVEGGEFIRMLFTFTSEEKPRPLYLEGPLTVYFKLSFIYDDDKIINVGLFAMSSF